MNVKSKVGFINEGISKETEDSILAMGFIKLSFNFFVSNEAVDYNKMQEM